jgi:hypothetical protein
MPIQPLVRAITVLTLLTIAAPLTATAQSRVMIGGRAAPGQTVRLRMTQEMDFELKPVGEPAPGIPKDGIRSKGKSTLLLKQDVGEVDAEGRLRLVLTYEDVSQEMKVNDVAVPIQEQANDALRGKVVTMVVGSNNEVLDVKAPEGFPIPPDQLKQFLGPLVASVPHQEMSVGETVSLPFSMALPMPTPGGAPPLLIGQTKTTLTALASENDDQIATLDQTFDVAIDSTNQTSAGNRVRMDVTISGSGTTHTFVKGGLVKSTTMKATMSGRFEPPNGTAALKLTGTMSMTVERVQ